MKVSKEDVIGVIAALEYWFGERDDAAEEQRWHDDLAAIARELAGVAGVETEVLPPGFASRVPSLAIRWDPGYYGLGSEALRQYLLDNEPRVMLDDIAATPASVQIEPFNLGPGEATMVGQAIAGWLRVTARPAGPAQSAPTMDISGQWEFTVHFLKGARRHRVTLEQRGGEVSGRHQSDGFSGEVTGRIDAAAVRLTFSAGLEGNVITYSFEGGTAPGGMAGSVLFGAAHGSNRGVLNLRQHGSGTWEAHRT
jgi:hypothetical protein